MYVCGAHHWGSWHRLLLFRRVWKFRQASPRLQRPAWHHLVPGLRNRPALACFVELALFWEKLFPVEGVCTALTTMSDSEAPWLQPNQWALRGAAGRECTDGIGLRGLLLDVVFEHTPMQGLQERFGTSSVTNWPQCGFDFNELCCACLSWLRWFAF